MLRTFKFPEGHPSNLQAIAIDPCLVKQAWQSVDTCQVERDGKVTYEKMLVTRYVFREDDGTRTIYDPDGLFFDWVVKQSDPDNWEQTK